MPVFYICVVFIRSLTNYIRIATQTNIVIYFLFNILKWNSLIDNEFKKKVRKEILLKLKKKKLSLNYSLKDTDLKYSNAYNFLYKKRFSALSREKVMTLLRVVREF